MKQQKHGLSLSLFGKNIEVDPKYNDDWLEDKKWKEAVFQVSKLMDEPFGKWGKFFKGVRSSKITHLLNRANDFKKNPAGLLKNLIDKEYPDNIYSK